MLKVIAPLVYLLLYVLSAPVYADGSRSSPGLLLQSSGIHSIPGVNILLLVADDMGYNDSAIYQDLTHQQPVTSMPALESLAKQGVRFSRFYTESTCSASRAALLTGQYAARNGFMPVARGISSDVITLPEFLKTKGYVTHHVGKWHMGEINPEAFPDKQGFDTSFGFLNQWMLKGPDANGKPQLKAPTYLNPWLMDEKHNSKQYEGHLEDILAKQTIDLIKKEKTGKQPWFIYHAFLAPHTPLEPAERFASRFDDTREGKHKAMLAQLDDSVLQMLSALKETKQWDNTIVIFVSDNGSSRGAESAEKHNNSNAPFSGKKAEYEEGGIRTPLLIKWQKSLQTQIQTRTDVVSIMDIYPSLASALGSQSTAMKNIDGVPSLLPINPQLRTTPLYFLTYGGLSVLSADGRYRLLREWDAGKFTRTELFEYDQSTIPGYLSSNWLEKILGRHPSLSKELFDDFLKWRNQFREVPVIVQGSNITGSNFLRTPINPSWAMAFAFTASDVQKKQKLLFQQGALVVTLEKGVLQGVVNGLIVKAAGIEPGICYSVVLSGEFYDKFSGVHGDIRISNLHLIVNGKEVDTATGKIESFDNLDISVPTVFGNITQPKIFLTQLLPNDEPIPSGFDDAINAACP